MLLVTTETINGREMETLGLIKGRGTLKAGLSTTDLSL